MKQIITKTGKKIIFAPPRLSDLKSMYRWVKTIEKEDTFVLLNHHQPISLKEETEFIKGLVKKIKAKETVFIAAFDQKKYIGGCSINKMGKRQGHVGIFGITLLKSYRGEGIGFQLAQYVIQQAKEKLALKQVTLNVFANNHVAIKLYRQLGFKKYGLQPKAVYYQGKYLDELLFYKNL